ncbi:MAG: peptidoglycan DD-metalloendopeptidase family protein [Bifidobacteriaceae bacterium]|nr:peptidoglycan DD-metalloendopeptidase family protein [Bifidobacteriaceae bacterium]
MSKTSGWRRPLAAAVAVLAAAAVAFAGAAAPTEAAPDKDDLERQRAANEAAIEQLEMALEGTDVELQRTYLDLEQANLELPIAEAVLAGAQAEFASAQKELGEITEALKQAEAQRDDVAEQLAKDVELARDARLSLGALARDAMMGRAAGDSELLVLLGSSSIDEAARDLMAVEAASRTQQSVIVQAQESAGANKNRQARLEAVTLEIADLKVKAEEALARADAAQAAAEQAKRELDELQASLERLAADLEAKKAADEARQAEYEAENEQIKKDLDKILEEERRKAAEEEAARKAAQQANGGSGGAGPPAATGFFGRPLSALRVGSPFGWRVHPIYGSWRHHDGVDLSASCHTPIYASAPGKVVFTGWAGGYGNRVVISHGNVDGQLMFTTYNHIWNGEIWVSTGQSVERGEQIANVGTTGASTGCHLHFEVGIGSASGVVDPMNYIS